MLWHIAIASGRELESKARSNPDPWLHTNFDHRMPRKNKKYKIGSHAKKKASS